MSIELVGLGKLLILFQATEAHRRKLLRDDIRSGIRAAGGLAGSTGGDFYIPFWADAKGHVAGELDLRRATEGRIASNDRRSRLYPMLLDGFILWWNAQRRRTNAPLVIHEDYVKARYPARGLGTIKVENTLSITVGDLGHQVIYPYFCEDPQLSEEAARVGLWIMSAAITRYAPEQLSILDVIAGRSFSVLETPLIGNEEQLFRTQYAQVLQQWRALQLEYA